MNQKHFFSNLFITIQLLSLAASAVIADDFSDEKRKGTLSVIIENDVLANTDKHYTNGLQIAYFNNPDDQPKWAERTATLLPFVTYDETIRTGLFFGHEIYTPDDIKTADILPNERPYAGWLYTGASVSSNTDKHFDVWRLNVGIVGPSAKGEEVQNGFHDIIGDDDAQGWDNQLSNRWGYMLIYERGWRFKPTGDKTIFGLETDIIPHAGISAGNVQRYANAGITFRIGNDLGNDFGPPRIRPSLPGSAFFDPQDFIGWNLFAGVSARYIDYNIFIEGYGSDEDRFNIDKKDWVRDVQVGAVMTVGGVRMSYTLVKRSKEFRQQDQSDKFGSIGISLKF